MTAPQTLLGLGSGKSAIEKLAESGDHSLSGLADRSPEDLLLLGSANNDKENVHWQGGSHHESETADPEWKKMLASTD